MSEDTNNRVLSRRGARQLTQDEIDRVAGARISSLLSVILTGPVSNPDERLDE